MAWERDPNHTAIFFSLHTSVELFKDPESPEAVVRAKQAAVLYDELIFEGGMLDTTILADGMSAFWHPSIALTPEMRERSRRVGRAPGVRISLALGDETTPGVPAAPENMRVFLEGPINASYLAEFHTGILDELAQFKPAWAKVVEFGGRDIPTSEPVGQAIADLNRQDSADRELMADRDTWSREFTYKSFNRDCLLASAFGAAFNITPLFQPMIDRRGVRRDSPGDAALGFVVPNLGGLPWEAVVEFREHPGSQEARAKLRDFEQLAGDEPQAAYALEGKIGAEIAGYYMQALADQQARLPAELAKEAVKGAVALVPTVGPLVATASTLAQAVLDGRAARRHWTAALLKLRLWE